MRIGIMSVFSEDQDRARHFDTGALGFQVGHDVPVDGDARCKHECLRSPGVHNDWVITCGIFRS